MQISEIKINNFRSIKDITIERHKYLILNGENNAGKSNILVAFRILYEDIKYSKSLDFPKFSTDDMESWIEVEYKLSNVEFELLKEEYKLDNQKMKILKYLFGNTYKF